MLEIVLIGSVKTSRGWHSDRKGRASLKGDAQVGCKRPSSSNCG